MSCCPTVPVPPRVQTGEPERVAGDPRPPAKPVSVTSESIPLASAPTATEAARALRVYVVEDSAIIRQNLVAALEELVGIADLGHADNEDDASAWLANPDSCWDLAIVDICLRHGTGFGVLQACRARAPERKIVVLTNYATPGVRERCLELGADTVFDKSAEIDGLLDYCIQLRRANAGDVRLGFPS